VVLAALAAALALSSCQTVRYKSHLPAGGPTHEQWAHFYAWGLAGSKDVDLDEVCPNGAHAWRNRWTFTNVLISFVTFGIYVPRTIEIECAGPSTEAR